MLPGQFPNQTYYDREHAIAELQPCGDVRLWYEVDSSSDLEMRAQLRRRTDRNPQTSQELRCCSQGIALSNIGWNRRCRAANLVFKGKVPVQLRRKSQLVGERREILTKLPSVERLQIAHPPKVASAVRRCGTQFPRLVVFSTPDRSRLPPPVSRV